MEKAHGAGAVATPAGALFEVFDQIPVTLTRGEGAYLFDTDGRRYVDFYGGHAVALLGYVHPALLKALDRQARTLFFQTNAAPLQVRERAASALLRFGPDGLSRVFFVNSGAEANENALRVAFLATGQPRVVAVEGAFHGRTAAAAAVTAGHQRWYGFPSEPFPVTWVPFDDVDALGRAIGNDVAAMIVEPVQGVAGARALSREFLARARELTSARGAVLIFDEVQCGMGRTGWPFASQAYEITPDLLTVAKGLGGGFPVAAVLARETLAAAVKKGDLGTTFGGGPLAMALVEAVIATIQDEGLLGRVRRLSQRLQQECHVGPVTAVQGMGFLLGLRTGPEAKQVIAALRDRGVLVGGSADPHVVRLLPPLILEDQHVDELVAALKGISC
ncbi:MAG: aspartate aminotransferase family protein [Thermoanaerobaculales bacterium]